MFPKQSETIFPLCRKTSRLTKEPIMKHRGGDFDVEQNPPSWWHRKIYPKIEAGPKVIGNMKFQSREAAVAACIVEINSGLDAGQRGGGSK
jgi:hypothetical protein